MIEGIKKKLTFSFCMLGMLASSFAQVVDSNALTADVSPEMQSEFASTDVDEKNSDFRPIIGIGGGMLTYFGDISQSQKANSPLLSNLAMSLKASFPLKNSLYVSFAAMYGNVAANERSIEKNRNFKSQITAFGFDVSYNFNHFLSEKRALDPYLSLGIDAFVFNSKTDLYDSEGRAYHYWSDGRIMDRVETPENLNTAVELNRDYEYETDYRKSNVSGAGYYEKYSFAVPIGAGVNMRLTHKMHAQLGVEYLFLLTDFMDGSTSGAQGIYKGNGKNDALLYTHIGLSYDLSKRSGSKDDPLDGISDEALAAMTTGDTDFDGISDLEDMCPETPAGIEVDARGCPFDEDGDGVPDYRDQELGTDSMAVVDSNGIALTDEQLQRIYLRFLDSNGTFSYYEDTIFTTDLPQRTNRIKASQYSVQVAGDSLTDGQAGDLLSEAKIKTVKDGDKDALLVGEFKTIEEAIAKDKELKEKGIQTRAIVQETPTGKVINADINGVFVTGESARKKEFEQGTVFRVQVGAFKGEPRKGYFDGMDVIGVKSSDGFTRYYAGNYKSIDDAASAQSDLRSKGFGDCLIKAFDDGSGSSGIGAVIPSDSEKPAKTGVNSDGKDRSKVRFKVQLGSYQNAIPMADFNRYVKIGEIKSEKGLDGLTRYFVGDFTSYAQAEAFKNELDEMGVPDAFIAGEYDGKTIPVEEAKNILK